MTTDYEDWVIEGTYKTKDGRTVKCIAVLPEDRAVFHDSESDGLWIVDVSGCCTFQANGSDIVDGPEVPDEDDEDLEELKPELEELDQLKQDVKAELEQWQDGYQEAIKDAICAAVTDATMDRQSLILFMRSLLSFYDYPMADPPF